MMERESDNFFQELKELVSDYLSSRIKLLKYDIYEKTAVVSAALFSSLVLAMLMCLVVFFLSIALGFYLGSLFNSLGTGFLVVTGFYLILLIFVISFRKNWIEKFVVNLVIEKLTEKEEVENES